MPFFEGNVRRERNPCNCITPYIIYRNRGAVHKRMNDDIGYVIIEHRCTLLSNVIYIPTIR